MALEKQVIDDKLIEEGIPVALSNGLTIETDEALTSWVDAYKTGLPSQNKKLEDYTKEELDLLAADPTFKGAKGLQGFTDAVRQKAGKKPETKPTPTPKSEEEPQWAKDLKENQQKILAKDSKRDFDANVSKLGKAENLTDTHIARVRKGLKTDATEAEIKAEIVSYKKELFEITGKELGTPGGGNKNFKADPKNSPSRRYAEKHQKKQKK